MNAPTVEREPHPTLIVGVLAAEFPAPLGSMVTPADVLALADAGASAPVARSEELRAAVRDTLRHGGYKPTGRGKPASEYLVKAAQEERFPAINLAVDVLNVVSLHSGLPISVVDLDVAEPPFRVALAEAGTSYVFNASGQTIDVSGLPCLFDEEGPCANAVKDSQRTKTNPSTLRTLSIVWAPAAFPEQCAAALAMYRELLESAGVDVA
ncbi:MAG: phenylalanine--tRNA ligase beta subunit-related protein [Planctomycetota bacterium]